jgi:hypothetical protein
LVALLDADDRWEPELLGSQLQHLQSHADCALVYADARISGETPLAGRTFMETTPSTGEVTVESLLRQRCTVLTSTVVVRRECLAQVGLFNPTLRRGHDFELWVRIAGAGRRIDYQRRLLAERRVRRNGLSGSPVRELDRACAVYLHLSRTLDFSSRERAALRERLAWITDRRSLECARLALADGDITAARRCLSQIARPAPKVRLVRAAFGIAPRLVRAAALASGRLTVDAPSTRTPREAVA